MGLIFVPAGVLILASNQMTIRQFIKGDEDTVIRLWQRCNLTRPVNDPRKDIRRKMKVYPELFLVGVIDNKIVATAMGGYDGHRGAVNYLGVDPDYQQRGLGRQLMAALEKKLIELGCPKLNLLVRTENVEAMKFYDSIGFKKDDCVEYGKRLIEDK
jgi:ribosomal protein S18 acetylase RimI-like enzyme